MDKKKYDVNVAGVEVSIISDEKEEFVMKLIDRLNCDITEIVSNAKRSSKLDAAILTALDYSCALAKAEKRVRNLEAQIALYDANLRRLRTDYQKLKQSSSAADSAATADKTSESKNDTAEQSAVEEKPLPKEQDIKEAKPEAVENKPEVGETKTENATKEPLSREDKLRQIAELLHRKDN